MGFKIAELFAEIRADASPIQQSMSAVRASCARTQESLDQTGQTAQNMSNRWAIGIRGGALQLGTQMFQVAMVARTAAAGIHFLSGVVAASKGNWDALDASMRASPLGMGAAYGAMYDLVALLDGGAEKAEKFRQKLEKQAQLNAAIGTAQQMQQGMALEKNLIGKTGLKRQEAEIDNWVKSQVDKIKVLDVEMRAKGNGRPELIARMIKEAEAIGSGKKDAARAAEADAKAKTKADKAKTMSDFMAGLQTRLADARGETNELDKAMAAMHIPDATPQQLAKIRNLMKEILGAEAGQKEQSRIANFAKAEMAKLQTPIEEFKKYREDVEAAFKQGLLGVGEEGQANKERMLSEKMASLRKTSGAAGRAASFVGIDDLARRIQESAFNRDDTAVKQLKVNEDQLAVLNDMNKKLGREQTVTE